MDNKLKEIEAKLLLISAEGFGLCAGSHFLLTISHLRYQVDDALGILRSSKSSGTDKNCQLFAGLANFFCFPYLFELHFLV